MPIMNAGWLQKATLQANKPKISIIANLKKKLGGMREGRSRSILHASDVTKPDFCPRKWAFLDMMKVESKQEFVPLAMDVTYKMGLITEKLLIEEWMEDSAIGNWCCRRCGSQMTMCSKPKNGCVKHKDCQWEYQQIIVESAEFKLQGGLDCLFDLGVPLLMLAEIKTINPDEFEKIVVPLPEHRLRTALYLKLIATSNSPYKNKFNLLEARVLYVSRGYGKMNPQWNEILPFKEFEVNRDDESIQPILQKAKALKIFREDGSMPNGICDTAVDKYAKKCSVCVECFSGQFPAQVMWQNLQT